MNVCVCVCVCVNITLFRSFLLVSCVRVSFSTVDIYVPLSAKMQNPANKTIQWSDILWNDVNQICTWQLHPADSLVSPGSSENFFFSYKLKFDFFLSTPISL